MANACVPSTESVCVTAASVLFQLNFQGAALVFSKLEFANRFAACPSAKLENVATISAKPARTSLRKCIPCVAEPQTNLWKEARLISDGKAERRLERRKSD